MKNLFLFIMLVLTLERLTQKTEKLELRVDSLIMPLVNTNNYSGSVLVSRNNKIILSKSYGKMSREYNLNNTPQTKFFLASASMIFTSAAILKLVEEGKLSLTGPLSKFLPDYKYSNEIIIHDLLAQRSGIPAIGAEGNVNYDSITKFAHSTEKLISYFKDYKLLYKPGTKYNHARSDYILLAYIIEKISGKSFGQYLKDEVFTPLGMNHTGHYSSEKEIVTNLARGYAPKDLYDVESANQIDWSSRTGHASIYSTTVDLQKFTQAVLENKFLTKDSWNKIFKNYGDNVGYGWFITKHVNRDRFQMNGRSPGYSSYLAIYPKEKLTVIMLSNNYISLPADVGKSIGALVLNEPVERLNLTNKTVDAEFAKKLTGTYRFGENFYRPNFELEISYKDGNVVSTWGGLIPIDKGDKNLKEYILRNYWSSIRFVQNEKGEITDMMYDTHKGLKVK